MATSSKATIVTIGRYGGIVAIDQVVIWSGVFLAFIITSISIALYRPGTRRRSQHRQPSDLATILGERSATSLQVIDISQLSNMRAMMDACPPSSASAAENSPTTDHAALTASKNATLVSTPDPRATPQHADSGGHTRSARANCSSSPVSCAHDAVSPAGQAIR